MSLTYLLVVILTAAVLCIGGLGVAFLISPRSFNKQKDEPYECGVPTRGRTWMKFEAGYYLFAILFLMFDIEAVFLFPWAVALGGLGLAGIAGIIFFFVVLVLGLAYAWRKGALEWK